MTEEIRVLLIEPGEKPRIVTVPHTLEELQKLVGGYIAATYPWSDCVGVVFDDDGMAKGYPPNRLLVDEDGKPYDKLIRRLIGGVTVIENGGFRVEFKSGVEVEVG